MAVRSSNNEQIVQKSIPPPKTADRQQSLPASRNRSPLPQLTNREHRRDRQRAPRSASHDQIIRPTIPQPTTTSYDLSSRQEARRNRRRRPSSDNQPLPKPSRSRSISPSSDAIHQEQVPRDRPRPLTTNTRSFRPIVSQPPTTSYDLSSRQEVRRNRRRRRSSDNQPLSKAWRSRSISPSFGAIHQQQTPRGRRRPLPPSKRSFHSLFPFIKISILFFL